MITRRLLMCAAPTIIIAKPNRAAAFSRSNPGVPAPAAPWAYSYRNFIDDFNNIGTIDINNTATSGYLWWPHNSWPNAVNDLDNGNIWRTASPTPSSAISISSSILTLSTDASTFGEGLVTAVANGAGYLGRTFTNGFYIEVVASFDPSAQNPGTSWPAWWSVAIEFLLGTHATFAELDIFEALQAVSPAIDTRMTIHLWQIVAGHATNTIENTASVSLGAVTYTNPHKYGLLWVPSTKNGGTGLLKYYFDDVNVASANLSYSGSSTFGTTVESEHFPIILGTGPNWPSHIDKVSVWQQSPNDMVVH